MTPEVAWGLLIGAMDKRIDMDRGIMEARQRVRVRQAAQKAAPRWLAEGRRVRIAIPPEPGSDFNDLLLMAREGCRAAA